MNHCLKQKIIIIIIITERDAFIGLTQSGINCEEF